MRGKRHSLVCRHCLVFRMLESARSRDELYQMSRRGQMIMDEIERSPKPIVAAIAGSCLGGGFEVHISFYACIL